jgi:hypothetical protein
LEPGLPLAICGKTNTGLRAHQNVIATLVNPCVVQAKTSMVWVAMAPLAAGPTMV